MPSLHEPDNICQSEKGMSRRRQERDRGGRGAADDGATGSSVSGSNLSMLVMI